MAVVIAWAQSRHEISLLALWHARAAVARGHRRRNALLAAVAVLSVRAARRCLSHEQWHTVHLLAYVGIALSFVHELAGPDLAGYRVLQVAWALLYAHVFALLLRYRVIDPIRQVTRHRLRCRRSSGAWRRQHRGRRPAPAGTRG
jgi:hypothetical protein